MKLIESYELLNQYIELKKLSLEQYINMDEKLSSELKQILKDEKYILRPHHLSRELLKNTFLSNAKAIEPRFRRDENCEAVIDLIVQYMRGDELFLKMDEAYTHNKGLLIMGQVGSGKTLIMKTFMRLQYKFESYSRYPGSRSIYYSIDSYAVAHAYQKKGYEIFSEQFVTDTLERINLKQDNLLIDDIGSEPVISHYGNVTNVIGELLTMRYDNKRVSTYSTSNLDAKTLKQHYGERTFSRMKEMFNFINLKGSDRRK
jgi:hypothetical protein